MRYKNAADFNILEHKLHFDFDLNCFYLSLECLL